MAKRFSPGMEHSYIVNMCPINICSKNHIQCITSDQSECAQDPIYIIISDKARYMYFSQSQHVLYGNFITTVNILSL